MNFDRSPSNHDRLSKKTGNPIARQQFQAARLHVPQGLLLHQTSLILCLSVWFGYSDSGGLADRV